MYIAKVSTSMYIELHRQSHMIAHTIISLSLSLSLNSAPPLRSPCWPAPVGVAAAGAPGTSHDLNAALKQIFAFAALGGVVTHAALQGGCTPDGSIGRHVDARACATNGELLTVHTRVPISGPVL